MKGGNVKGGKNSRGGSVLDLSNPADNAFNLVLVSFLFVFLTIDSEYRIDIDELIRSTDGKLKAITDFLIYSNCGAKSSGASDLFAL